MKNLLIFLGALFYVNLALIFAAAFIDQRRAARRQATEPKDDTSVQKAA
jgi:hypothetical protein